MRRIIFSISFSLITALAYAQYDNVSSFGEYQEHWTMVTVEGKSGFIDNTGKVIVKPVYDYISPFGEYQEHWAMATVEGKTGFIDNTGKEVTKPE
jgi:hypothetical protein